MPLTQDVWEPFNLDGIEVKQTQGRFGMVTELYLDGFGWMQTNPIDLLDHSIIETFYGDVLLTGLGLGLGVLIANSNPKVTSITVVENDQRVIDACPFPELFNLVKGDADKFAGQQYDCAFLDHHKTSIPDEVVAHYKVFCSEVVCWYDEYQKVANSL